MPLEDSLIHFKNQDHEHQVAAPAKTQEMKTRFKGGVSAPSKAPPPNTCWAGNDTYNWAGWARKIGRVLSVFCTGGRLASVSDVTQVRLRNYKGKNARSAVVSESYTGWPQVAQVVERVTHIQRPCPPCSEPPLPGCKLVPLLPIGYSSVVWHCPSHIVSHSQTQGCEWTPDSSMHIAQLISTFIAFL